LSRHSSGSLANLPPKKYTGRGVWAIGSSTAADVYVGSGIGFGMQFGMIEKRPAFERYWHRLSARPAAQRAEEIDDALAAQQPQTPG